MEEYPSTGHEFDVFAVTPEGISVYVEIIWTATDRNFFRDMNMIQQSDADVKMVVVNPQILGKEKYLREFSKVAISQRRIGIAMHGELFDGVKLIEDRDYLDVEFKEALLSLIRQVQLYGKVPPVYAEFTPPQPPSADKVQERLLSNLFLVKDYPSAVFSARTYVRRDAEVFGKLGNEIEKYPFILKRRRIYTFENLKNPQSPFFPIIDLDDFKEEKVSEWIQDKDKRNDLIRLFNLALRVYCRERGLKYDKKHRRFVCLLKNGKDNVFTWRAGSRYTRRTVAKLVYGRSGKLLYCRHHAASLRFISIDNNIFLKIEPTITFTYDGYRPIRPNRIASLMSRWLPKQFNYSYLLLVRFWAMFLSKLDIVISIPAGERKIEVAANPMFTRMNVGIVDERGPASKSLLLDRGTHEKGGK